LRAAGAYRRPMDGTSAAGDGAEVVEWRRRPATAVPTPLVRSLPYLELKLEHPGLEPTGRADRFFPDAVPYELGGTARVFYWRSALPADADPDDWTLAAASTHGLRGADGLPAEPPPLVDGGDATTVVVDGTVGGDATTARLRPYAVPAVTITDVSPAAAELAVDGDRHDVSAGERRRVRLPERRVEPVGGEPTTAAPELAVRYPGRRELHHPAPGGDVRLFPSFGLELDAVPSPLSVPTAAGELDDAALAGTLGVDLSARPYPERALWQAFAHTAFDPHGGPAALAQLASGHLAVWPP